MEKKYNQIIEDIKKIVSENKSRDSALFSICELLENRITYFSWVGFYLVNPDKENELILGPFVGEPTDHKIIGFGEGICGQAAVTEETYVIQDVTEETNYLSCSINVKSEIVVPIFKNGEFTAELDIDSHEKNPFSDIDKIKLEEIAEMISELF